MNIILTTMSVLIVVIIVLTVEVVTKTRSNNRLSDELAETGSIKSVIQREVENLRCETQVIKTRESRLRKIVEEVNRSKQVSHIVVYFELGGKYTVPAAKSIREGRDDDTVELLDEVSNVVDKVNKDEMLLIETVYKEDVN